MDAAAHYRHLLTLGREEFLAAAAPAVLVRYRARTDPAIATSTRTITLDDVRDLVDETRPHGKLREESTEMELYPLAKKPGASFPDRITIGRTANNDVEIADPSVSRLHAYVRHGRGSLSWQLADAGSKNGTWLAELRLEPRREAELAPGAQLRLGDVVLTFYRAADLFELHGGDHGRR